MAKLPPKRVFILFAILFFPSLFWLLLSRGHNHFKHLEHFGMKTVNERGDTTYHSIPSFSFVNQEGKTISQKDLDGKIYVANFFFATCPTICPKMNDQLHRVQQAFKDNDDIKILSHTVDPDRDSVSVLNEYAKRHEANNKQWWFLTGNKDSIYSIAANGYMVNAAKGIKAEDFFHSQDLILVDKEKHIRAIRDGLDQSEVDTLIDEIKVLIHEYKENKK